MVINSNKNYGWYIIPFSVNDTSKWNKEIKNRLADDDYYEASRVDKDHYEAWRIPVMSDCTRLFSYITDIFKTNTDISGVYKVNSRLYKKLEFPEKKPIEFDENKTAIVPVAAGNRAKLKYNATADDAFIVYYNKIGFLVFEIGYNDMSIDDIINFAHRFKRMGDSRSAVKSGVAAPHKDGQGYLLGNIWSVVEGIINTSLVQPFFYSSCVKIGDCNILQFVNYDFKPEDSAVHLLGRGYDSSFAGVDMKGISNVDMKFEPYTYIQWRGCQSVMACIANNAAAAENSAATEYFVKSFLPQAIRNDYLYMYILLLLQRYTLLYFIGEMTRAGDNKALQEIYNEMLNFKQSVSFNVVSNELTYQNIYNEMMRVLDINNLFEDINDLSEKVMSQDEKRQEGAMNNLSLVLAIMGIAEIVPTVFQGFFKEDVAQIIASVVSICLIALAGVLFFVNNHKYKKGK